MRWKVNWRWEQWIWVGHIAELVQALFGNYFKVGRNFLFQKPWRISRSWNHHTQLHIHPQKNHTSHFTKDVLAFFFILRGRSSTTLSFVRVEPVARRHFRYLMVLPSSKVTVCVSEFTDTTVHPRATAMPPDSESCSSSQGV